MKVFHSICILALIASWALGVDVTIKITNATKGIHFTPLLVTAHASTTKAFTVGSQASSELKAMAEGGDIEPLTTFFGNRSQFSNNPAGGLLAAGSTATATIRNLSASNTHLSILGMMLPTNDGFIAVNAMQLPTSGTHMHYAMAYDSGTEANDELSTSIPDAVPTASGGTGIATEAEGFVHIHRGVVGDDNRNGGKSDLNFSMHRWLNPIAIIEITVL